MTSHQSFPVITGKETLHTQCEITFVGEMTPLQVGDNPSPRTWVLWETGKYNLSV